MAWFNRAGIWLTNWDSTCHFVGASACDQTRSGRFGAEGRNLMVSRVERKISPRRLPSAPLRAGSEMTRAAVQDLST